MLKDVKLNNFFKQKKRYFVKSEKIRFTVFLNMKTHMR